MSESLPVCLDDLSPLVAGEDVHGRYLICRACYKLYRIPDVFHEQDWQQIHDAANPPTPQEMARRRVRAFLETRRSFHQGDKSGLDADTIYALGGKNGNVELRVSDLELLVGEGQ